jgi:hypothetical protein
VKVTERPYTIPPRDESKRSLGLHLSDILQYERARRGVESDAPKAAMFWEHGLMWEEVITKDHGRTRPELIIQEELFLDGIYLTPDAYNIVEECIEEYKVTWKSMNKLGPENADSLTLAVNLDKHFWMYVAQVKSYCYARKTLKARLAIYYTNGNYLYGENWSGPMPRDLYLEFSNSELRDNWRMIQAIAKEMRG